MVHTSLMPFLVTLNTAEHSNLLIGVSLIKGVFSCLHDVSLLSATVVAVLERVTVVAVTRLFDDPVALAGRILGVDGFFICNKEVSFLKLLYVLYCIQI